MAITKEVIIKADTTQAVKSVEEFVDEVDKISDSAEQAEDSLKDVGKTAKDQTKVVKGLGGAVKGVGIALKAIGIGLIIALVAKLTEVFSKNQKVIDFLSTAMETLSIAFNDLFNFIGNNIGKVTGFFKDLFENPLDNIKEFGRLIKENIIERFESALEVVGFLGKALKQLFSGDFKGALDSAKEAGKELVDVMTGVDDSTTKITEGVKGLVNAVSDYASETYNAAKANIELANTAQLAAAQQARLVEQFDRQAEIQRQLRDNTSISIKERQKANEELGKILEEQEKAMLRLASLQVAAAQAQLNTNNNIENQVALTEALTNKEGVLAQVEGFRSEQLVNRIALKKEEIDLDNSISSAEKERRILQLEFEASQEDNLVTRLQKQREVLEEENQIIIDDIERKREIYEEGTQARVDAENEYLARKQEIDNQLVLNTKDVNDQVTEDEKKAAEQRKTEEEILADQKEAIAQDTLSLITSISKKGSAIAKGVAVAQIVRDQVKSVTQTITNTGAANARALVDLGPIAGAAAGIRNTVQAGLSIGLGAASAAKSIKDILAEKKSPSTGGGSVGGGGGRASAPAFNLVAGSGTNQIAEGLAGEPTPIRAFVVSSEVTNAQSLDRNIESNASFG